MTDIDPQSRRTVLSAALASGVTITAGCIGLYDDVSDDESSEDDASDDESSEDDASDDDTGDSADSSDSSPAFDVETVADGLASPWGMTFLEDESTLLVTEREGNLQRLDPGAGTRERVEGVPDVFAAGQGGLLDVAVSPASDDEWWVYLTYAATNDDGESATHLGRGRLERASTTLTDFEAMFVAEPFIDSDGHYGSRVVVGPDEMLYMTSGDRQLKEFSPDHVSQDLTNELGATIRIEPDGSIPDDNPFVDDPDVRDAIYSYGHRNAQGMTIHPETDAIWQSEHGEQDGDSITIIERGGNHGWPIAHYGCTYIGDDPVGDRPDERDDVVDPVYYWECNSGGFPPAGMTFYDGEAFPDWQGDLFVGNLAGQYLGHFTVDETDLEERNPLLADRNWRIRDVVVGPETDTLYVAVDDESAPVVRLVPA